MTVHDFIALYTHSYIFYSHGAINFYMQEHFTAEMLAPFNGTEFVRSLDRFFVNVRSLSNYADILPSYETA